MSKKGLRIEEILVQAVVVEYDDVDRPIARVVTQPISLFRARSKDVWAEVDMRLKNSQVRAVQDAPVPTSKKSKGVKR